MEGHNKLRFERSGFKLLKYSCVLSAGIDFTKASIHGSNKNCVLGGSH